AVPDIRSGMVLEVAPGDTFPADGVVVDGHTDVDRSMLTGEARPEPGAPGDAMQAGMMNLTGRVLLRVSAAGEDTVIAEIARMMDAAERGRGRHDLIADRAARIYAPAVHVLAVIAFASWYWTTSDLRIALNVATAVLIVTCPCALALAVPVVHTVATGRLFRRGIFLKQGGDLDRLAEVDTIVFDKTGTLTDGTPKITKAPPSDSPAWPIAAALAAASRHPFSRAIREEAERRGIRPIPLDATTEEHGFGVSARTLDGTEVRLGRPTWTGRLGEDGVGLSYGTERAAFFFDESLRADARDACNVLKTLDLDLSILSGDADHAVDRVAGKVGIADGRAGLSPCEKMAALNRRARSGQKVLMVGDGLNDGPALASAYVSMSPASATDFAKSAAGIVFAGASLRAVPAAIRTARQARSRALQCFAIALAYNAVTIPLAFMGFVTPLVAALAMSGSSIVVVLNALRHGDADK
ncbi:MAG: heavy metal translocating P-type ATPase, partial [Pseudomonadota bacterium]